MTNWTEEFPILKSQRSELVGQIVRRCELTIAQRDTMFALMAEYYETQRTIFDADLDEKEHVILMTDAETGIIKGFSTMVRLELESVTALFSGDTIIHADYRHTTVLPREWAKLAFSTLDSIRAVQPERQVYWFLITSGYKTYRYLPLFFKQFYPRYDEATPTAIQTIMDELACSRYPDEYNPQTGIIRLKNATPLQEGVADIQAHRLKNLHIEYFVRVNPDHANGDELVCLTAIDRNNLTRAGQRMVQE
jgi:hypothetical protein